MAKTHETAIVAIPPENVWEPIQKIRQVHDSKIHRWMPHVTLIYPFCLELQFAEVASELTPACKKLRSIDVTMRPGKTYAIHLDTDGVAQPGGGTEGDVSLAIASSRVAKNSSNGNQRTISSTLAFAAQIASFRSVLLSLFHADTSKPLNALDEC